MTYNIIFDYPQYKLGTNKEIRSETGQLLSTRMNKYRLESNLEL